MTRGFVTLATGKDSYYKQARNLLRSFRLHNHDAKFAIICDCENKYTSEFDDVVLLKDASQSYRDKFRLLTDCPYDENIFIEADCLIYRNLDNFWELLAKEWDFSSFGWNDAPFSYWLGSEENVHKLCRQLGRKPVKSMPMFNPGYLFIRKWGGEEPSRGSESVSKMFDDIAEIEKYLLDNRSEFPNVFVKGNMRDDPLLCLAMEFNGMRCAADPSKGKCLAVPTGYVFKNIDILSGELDVTDKKGDLIEDCSLLHFSSRRANEEGMYPWQVAILNAGLSNAPNFWIRILKSRAVMYWFDFIMTVYRTLKRLKPRRPANLTGGQ